MSNYSGDAHLVSVTTEKTRIGRADSYNCYSFTRETLQSIADIFGNGWFVRDFQEGDNVDFCFMSTIRSVENPQYAHLLAHPKYKWGLMFFRAGENGSVYINVIHLDSGECKYITMQFSINNYSLFIYNTTANTKIITNNNNDYYYTIIISSFKEMLSNSESMFVYRPYRTELASLDGEYVCENGNRRSYSPLNVNYSRYVLVKYICALDNYLFASNGDIMTPTLKKSSANYPRIINIQNVNYLFLFTYDTSYFFRIEDND